MNETMKEIFEKLAKNGTVATYKSLGYVKDKYTTVTEVIEFTKDNILVVIELRHNSLLNHNTIYFTKPLETTETYLFSNLTEKEILSAKPSY